MTTQAGLALGLLLSMLGDPGRPGGHEDVRVDGLGSQGDEVLARIEVGADRVEFGKEFPLSVLRRWDRELVPEGWNDHVLSPLIVQLTTTTRREDGRWIVETRSFRCYAFEREKVTVPAWTFTARPLDGGVPRVATVGELELSVEPALKAGELDPPELPGPPLADPRRWLFWPWGGLALTATLAWLTWWVRRPRGLAGPLPAERRALEGLRALRAASEEDEGRTERFHVAAAALVRAYIEEQVGLPAEEMTSEEFLDAPRTAAVLPPSTRARLSDFLAACDRVKFARQSPTPVEVRHMLTAGRDIVTEIAARGTVIQDGESRRRGDTP